VKLFTDVPGSEERQKEAERRKSEFRRKLSTFSGEKIDEVSTTLKNFFRRR
jgi:hypothetical protein